MSIVEPRDLIEVLNRLESWREKPEGPERRNARRYPVRGDAWLQPLDPAQQIGPPHKLMLRDISCTGVGFVCEASLAIGSAWRIVLADNGLQLTSQPMIVRFVRVIHEELYLVGAQFVIDPCIMRLLGVPCTELSTDSDNDETEADCIPPEVVTD
jgi:c-di-GMP-binding flagellar brake protein YcgR